MQQSVIRLIHLSSSITIGPSSQKKELEIVNYRRSTTPGGTFFFTVTLQDRKSTLLVENIHLLKEAVYKVKAEQCFQIKAYVILPEHLHMIWQLPEGNSNTHNGGKKIKALFSKSLHKTGLPIARTKHGLAKSLHDWPYSSFHYYTERCYS